MIRLIAGLFAAGLVIWVAYIHDPMEMAANPRINYLQNVLAFLLAIVFVIWAFGYNYPFLWPLVQRLIEAGK